MRSAILRSIPRRSPLLATAHWRALPTLAAIKLQSSQKWAEDRSFFLFSCRIKPLQKSSANDMRLKGRINQAARGGQPCIKTCQ